MQAATAVVKQSLSALELAVQLGNHTEACHQLYNGLDMHGVL